MRHNNVISESVQPQGTTTFSANLHKSMESRDAFMCLCPRSKPLTFGFRSVQSTLLQYCFHIFKVHTCSPTNNMKRGTNQMTLEWEKRESLFDLVYQDVEQFLRCKGISMIAEHAHTFMQIEKVTYFNSLLP